jgi:hypothetical protein
MKKFLQAQEKPPTLISGQEAAQMVSSSAFDDYVGFDPIDARGLGIELGQTVSIAPNDTGKFAFCFFDITNVHTRHRKELSDHWKIGRIEWGGVCLGNPRVVRVTCSVSFPSFKFRYERRDSQLMKAPCIQYNFSYTTFHLLVLGCSRQRVDQERLYYIIS